MANKKPTGQAESKPCQNVGGRRPPLQEALPSHVAAIAASFRCDSKLRALMRDEEIGCEMIAVAYACGGAQFQRWLAAHGAEMNLKNAYGNQKKLQMASEKIARRVQIQRSIREQYERAGTTPAKATLTTVTDLIGDIVDAAQNIESEVSRETILECADKLKGIRDTEVKEEGNKLKERDLDLALQKYKDAAQSGVDMALKEFAAFVKRFPSLRAAYDTFNAAVRKALQEAA